jgi:hypothetical protein
MMQNPGQFRPVVAAHDKAGQMILSVELYVCVVAAHDKAGQMILSVELYACVWGGGG